MWWEFPATLSRGILACGFNTTYRAPIAFMVCGENFPRLCRGEFSTVVGYAIYRIPIAFVACGENFPRLCRGGFSIVVVMRFIVFPLSLWHVVRTSHDKSTGRRRRFLATASWQRQKDLLGEESLLGEETSCRNSDPRLSIAMSWPKIKILKFLLSLGK